jgi:hypothetical protein
MNNPGFVQYKIGLTERRGDKTFETHNDNTLRVLFNKEKETALEKYVHSISLLLLS